MDYRNFGPNGPVSQSVETTNRRWWTMKPKDAADSVSACLKLLRQYQTARLSQYVISARLYGNLPVMGLAGLSLSQLNAAQNAMRDRIAYNVVQSVVDTAQSKMAKNKPKPLFLTSGGDYKVQRKAKKLNQYTDGIFYENKAYDLGIEAFRDGLVLGDGLVHVFERDSRVAWERVLPSELWVDEVEAFYGSPRSYHRVKDVDKDELAAAIPEARKKIFNAQPPESEQKGGTHKTISNMVTVRQSWHLPSGPDANDGKTIITIDGDALTEMMPWKHPFPPFARFRWCPRMWGFWSQGVAEQIQNIQVEINKILWVIQRSFHLAGSFKILLEVGSKIVKEHLNNDIGAIVNYTGTKPEYVVPPIVPPEMYQHLLALKQSAYEQAGISTLNASGTKPAGLNSGKALREFDDIGTDRFLTPGQRYQNFFLDLARLSIAVAKDIAEENRGHYEVKVPGKKFLETVDWSDIDLEDDEYVMQCFPVSNLPTDPAGRLETIQEYAQAGYLTPRQARKLLDFPDLDQVEGLASAEEDYLQETLDKIVDEGVYIAPEPFDDLNLALELAAEYYARGKCQGLEEEKLDLLRKFMSQVKMMLESAESAIVAQQPTQPQAQPQPPPTSDLVPNVPAAA